MPPKHIRFIDGLPAFSVPFPAKRQTPPSVCYIVRQPPAFAHIRRLAEHISNWIL